MTQPTVPAPALRRLAAALYDVLLLAALWMSVSLFYVLARDALGARDSPAVLRLLLLLAGFAFFGWPWTHGGATPGMRAWKLEVRRSDGAPLRWPVALVRYGALLCVWSLVATPAIACAIPRDVDFPHRMAVIAVAVGLALLAALSLLVDPRRRAPHDRLAETEVVFVPRR
jgi:uncharacterized RDD family membrane protein YckC